MANLRRTIANSRFARVAALPTRAKSVISYDARILGRSARWLVTSKEHTNYTFDLTSLNLEHLAWWVADSAGISVGEARGFIHEIANDEELVQQVRSQTQLSSRSGLADTAVRLHRRMGWYALARAVQPEHIVETGTDKGLGSLVLAAAVLRNGKGVVTTIDVNVDAGYLIAGRYAEAIHMSTGNSLEILATMKQPVDMFIHDSLHTRSHEMAEFLAVEPRLSPGALVLSDNSHVTDALPAWAEATGRSFTYFQEVPNRHWSPGAGIGLARRR